jgi:hypothetical protein
MAAHAMLLSCLRVPPNNPLNADARRETGARRLAPRSPHKGGL